jgi:hypothetical protein
MNTIINTNKKNKPVKCIETDTIYNSTSEAARAFGCSHDLISCNCRGKVKTAKGMHFEFINQPDVVIHVKEEPKPIELKRHVTIQKEAVIEANGTRDNGNCKSVMCITDGKSFASMVDAAEHYGVATSQISYACKEKGRTAAGKQFCKFSDLYLYIPEISKAINDQTAYDILLEKENTRKAMIANVSKLEEEAYAIELKMNEVKQALEQAKMELANFG